MSAAVIYCKTALGNTEMKLGQSMLDAPTRKLLILLDGKRSVASLQPLFRNEAELNNALVTLTAGEFIKFAATLVSAPTMQPAVALQHADNAVAAAPVAAVTEHAVKRFIDGQRFMNEAIRSNLGMKALFFTMKIERCSNVQDCLAMMEDFEGALIRAMKDDIAAEKLRKQAEQILLGT